MNRYTKIGLFSSVVLWFAAGVVIAGIVSLITKIPFEKLWPVCGAVLGICAGFVLRIIKLFNEEI